MIRRLMAGALAIVLASPLVAQLPAGWKVRSDVNGTDAQTVLALMPPGWHLSTTSPGSIVWDPSFVATGRYALEWEVHVFPATPDGEPFGLFIGGAALEGPEVTGIVVKFTRDGMLSVTRRTGRTSLIILASQPTPSFVAPKGTDPGRNIVRVSVEADSVRIDVNGTRAGAFAANRDTDGIFGFRLGGGTNLHVSRLDKIIPFAPAAPRTGGM